jgi:hypothetical protein
MDDKWFPYESLEYEFEKSQDLDIFSSSLSSDLHDLILFEKRNVETMNEEEQEEIEYFSRLCYGFIEE